MGDKLGKPKDDRVLFNGLSSTGKSTLIHQLKSGEFIETYPTVDNIFDIQTIEHNNMSLQAWEAGGREKIRPLWRHHFDGMSAFVVVMDSNNRDSFDDLKEDLIDCSREKGFYRVSIAIVCNKQDLPNSATVQEVRDEMDLDGVMKGHTSWTMFGASALTGEGVPAILEWITNEVKNNVKGGSKEQKKDKKENVLVEKLKKLFLTV